MGGLDNPSRGRQLGEVPSADEGTQRILRILGAVLVAAGLYFSYTQLVGNPDTTGRPGAGSQQSGK